MTLFEKIHTKHGCLKTVADVKAFFATLCEDMAWHPDNPFADYVSYHTGEPTFTPEEAKTLDDIMLLSFLICTIENVDPYGLACDALNEQYLKSFDL